MSYDGWIRNPGHRISEAEGRRVQVRLRNGLQPSDSWAADPVRGTPGCRWTLTGDEWDIIEFRIAG